MRIDKVRGRGGGRGHIYIFFLVPLKKTHARLTPKCLLPTVIEIEESVGVLVLLVHLADHFGTGRKGAVRGEYEQRRVGWQVDASTHHVHELPARQITGTKNFFLSMLGTDASDTFSTMIGTRSLNFSRIRAASLLRCSNVCSALYRPREHGAEGCCCCHCSLFFFFFLFS